MTSLYIPEAIFIEYLFDPTEKRYKLHNQPLSFNRLSLVAKIEVTQKKDKIPAPFVFQEWIAGKWNESPTTGLKPITDGLFYGDHKYNDKRSYMIFSFSPDKQRLVILYHRGFYPNRPIYRDQLNENHFKAYHQKKWSE